MDVVNFAGVLAREATNFSVRGIGVLRASNVTDEASLTPLDSIYGARWEATLQRRLAEERPAFFEPFSSNRTQLCGATVTHATAKREQCLAVARNLGAGDEQPENPDSLALTAGVYLQDDDECIVILNRAVSRGTADGFLLGVDCIAWYGLPGDASPDRWWGHMMHASHLAVEVTIRLLLEQERSRYLSALRKLRCDGSPAVSSVLSPEAISEIFAKILRKNTRERVPPLQNSKDPHTKLAAKPPTFGDLFLTLEGVELARAQFFSRFLQKAH